MNEDRCRDYVSDLLPGLLWAFQLQQWHVTVHYVEPKDDGPGFTVVGQCELNPLRWLARIDIAAEPLETRAEVASVLAHELGHVLLAEMEVQMNLALDACPGATARGVLHSAYMDATERVAMRFERMFQHGLGLKPIQLARRGRDRRRKAIRE